MINNELSRDLNVADCNAGIDRAELRECMNDINTAQCGNPIDTITRLAACCTSTSAATPPSACADRADARGRADP